MFYNHSWALVRSSLLFKARPFLLMLPPFSKPCVVKRCRVCLFGAFLWVAGCAAATFKCRAGYAYWQVLPSCHMASTRSTSGRRHPTLCCLWAWQLLGSSQRLLPSCIGHPLGSFSTPLFTISPPIPLNSRPSILKRFAWNLTLWRLDMIRVIIKCGKL